ncbi:MAG: hypothetical protein ABR497_03255 [Kiritimatiellia bacterium]|nr:hypothetical protein [Lentisphaerota bacterium]
MTKKTMSILTVAAGLALTMLLIQRLRQLAPRPAAPSSNPRIAAYEEQTGAFMQVDPELILYHETAALRPPGLATVTAVATDDEHRIYAGGGRQLVVMDRTGTELRRMTFTAAVTCLATDPQNNLYVGLGNQVESYKVDGALRTRFTGIRQEALITSLAADGEVVFAADAADRKVMRFSADGVLQLTIDGRENAGGPGFSVPSPYFDVFLGQGRTLWVVNPGRQRLEEYNYDGEHIGGWEDAPGLQLENFCGCCNPSHAARLSDGAIVTSEKGIARIKIYTRRGAFTGVVAAPGMFDSQILSLDLAVDAHDRILVTDPARVKIRIFELINYTDNHNE